MENPTNKQNSKKEDGISLNSATFSMEFNGLKKFPVPSSHSTFKKFVRPKTPIKQQQPQNNSGSAASKSNTKQYKNQNIVKSLTLGIIVKYRLCSNEFQYNHSQVVPRKVLTKKSETSPAWNNGLDNEDGNLILMVNDVLNGRYVVKDLVGEGTFGQVARCEDLQQPGKQVAVKVIKNKQAYLRQAMVEKEMLELVAKEDPEDKHHLIRMISSFEEKAHLCLVFELLSINLFELIKSNRFQGLSTNVIRVFLSQMLDALCVLYKLKVIHCDLKPENILLTEVSPEIKIIDLGSACQEDGTVYSYIQSRFYRSPEVLLGCEYDCAIDMWSLGCICAELFLGLPLFPGQSQYNQVARIVEMLGYPPGYMIEEGKFAGKYFKPRAMLDMPKETTDFADGETFYEMKTEEEFCQENRAEIKGWKRYFTYNTLEEIILHYTFKNVPPADREKEKRNRLCFIDFLRGLLRFDPKSRWTPEQALQHPFVTGKEFTAPFEPEKTTEKQLSYLKKLESYRQTKLFQFKQFQSPGMAGVPIQRRPLVQPGYYAQSPQYTPLGYTPTFTQPQLGQSPAAGYMHFSPMANFSMTPQGTPIGTPTYGPISALGPSPTSHSALRQMAAAEDNKAGYSGSYNRNRSWSNSGESGSYQYNQQQPQQQQYQKGRRKTSIGGSKRQNNNNNGGYNNSYGSAGSYGNSGSHMGSHKNRHRSNSRYTTQPVEIPETAQPQQEDDDTQEETSLLTAALKKTTLNSSDEQSTTTAPQQQQQTQSSPYHRSPQQQPYTPQQGYYPGASYGNPVYGMSPAIPSAAMFSVYGSSPAGNQLGSSLADTSSLLGTSSTPAGSSFPHQAGSYQGSYQGSGSHRSGSFKGHHHNNKR